MITENFTLFRGFGINFNFELIPSLFNLIEWLKFNNIAYFDRTKKEKKWLNVLTNDQSMFDVDENFPLYKRKGPTK